MWSLMVRIFSYTRLQHTPALLLCCMCCLVVRGATAVKEFTLASINRAYAHWLPRFFTLSILPACLNLNAARLKRTIFLSVCTLGSVRPLTHPSCCLFVLSPGRLFVYTSVVYTYMYVWALFLCCLFFSWVMSSHVKFSENSHVWLMVSAWSGYST